MEGGGETEVDPSMLQSGEKKLTDMDDDVYVLEPSNTDQQLTKVHGQLAKL